MKTIGQFEFPETLEGQASWQPMSTMRGLAMRVLVVSHTRQEGTWCAYCDAVPGRSHYDEAHNVFQHGEKLEPELAKSMLPCFEGIPYAL